MSFNIIVKDYDHYNRVLNKRIRTKHQYNDELKRQGYVPQEVADDLARNYEERKENVKYKVSDKAREVLNAARARADKKGNVKLCDRTIEGMREVGVQIDLKHCPKHYLPKEGGFE